MNKNIRNIPTVIEFFMNNKGKMMYYDDNNIEIEVKKIAVYNNYIIVELITQERIKIECNEKLSMKLYVLNYDCDENFNYKFALRKENINEGQVYRNAKICEEFIHDYYGYLVDDTHEAKISYCSYYMGGSLFCSGIYNDKPYSFEVPIDEETNTLKGFKLVYAGNGRFNLKKD